MTKETTMQRKMLIYNDDGWSSYMRYPAPMSLEDVVAATVGPVIGTAVTHYQFCALGGHAVNYNSSFLPRVGEMMKTVDTIHVWRMRETLRQLERQGTDPLRIVSGACRKIGIVCQFSLRMNDRHHTYKHADGSWYFPELLSPWLDEHPELLLADRALDYAQAQVADYRKKQIQEIIDNYDVAGIDLDFTRFKPWFRPGEEEAGMPKMSALVCDLREMTRKAGKTLSARFEYDAGVCIASGLDAERWLAEGLFDQITLGGVGDHTPDAPADWWVEHAHQSGCTVCPGIEGQLHWVPGCGGGGTGTRAGDGVHDGFGPPFIAYMRAVAANHYRSGADGISLFNFTCADGAFDRAAFTELADPQAIAWKDKQYVAAMWPHDAQIYYAPWTSRFRLAPGMVTASYELGIADDIDSAIRQGRAPTVRLTLDLMGVNRLADIEVSINGTPLVWTGYDYNHWDHGCWTDIVQFEAPAGCLRTGDNRIGLKRLVATPGFDGSIEVRKCILELCYPETFAPGNVGGVDATPPSRQESGDGAASTTGVCQATAVDATPPSRQESGGGAASTGDGILPLPHYFDPADPVGHVAGGNLPHWRQKGATYFVTFRTADSMPKERVDRWTRERAEWLSAHPEPRDVVVRQEYYRLFTEKWQNWLDESHGACLLVHANIASVVERCLRHDDGIAYRLGEFVIMPNHVHALVTPLGNHTLSYIVQAWKSVTAHAINAIACRKGAVWQKESFDHIVRSADQLGRIRKYIQNNPKRKCNATGVDATPPSRQESGDGAASTGGNK